jgi:hypothetical protein
MVEHDRHVWESASQHRKLWQLKVIAPRLEEMTAPSEFRKAFAKVVAPE